MFPVGSWERKRDGLRRQSDFEQQPERASWTGGHGTEP